MKLISQLLVILFFLQFNSCSIEEKTGEVIPREKRNFTADWQFQKGDTLNTGWQAVTIPHTTNLEPLVVNDQWQGISWYKKKFVIDGVHQSKKFFLYFEGVMQEADVWFNGKKMCNHKGGYLPFTIDISSEVKSNVPNEILIRVDNQDNTSIPPGKPLKNLDFNLYGGIYRNVYLIKTNEVFISDAVHAGETNGGGVLIHFDDISQDKAKALVKIHVQNDSDTQKTIKAKVTFSGEDKPSESITSKEFVLEPNSSQHIEQSITLNAPKMWSPETPHLYNVKVGVYSDDQLLDVKTLRSGIRSIALTDNGFFLNGKQRFINGTNRHQEYPFVGYAISDNANYRDAFKIKQAGFDFVRLSHYPHSESFMDACDELGLMVMNCIPGWQYSEEGEFIENSFQDIRDMVRRDRNHPSVIIWENSLNESSMTASYIIKANEILDQELPYNDIFSAGWMDHSAYDIFIPARQHANPPFYWNKYDKEGRKVLIAEYGDWEYYAQNAGFSQKEFKDLKDEERTSRQLRGDGEKRLLQQALNYQEAFNSNVKGGNTIGHANWLMFDYNRGYSDDLEASGISDIFRIPKFAYYFYQSQKPPYQDNFTGPMVFIANFWQNTTSKEVKVFSNCEEVELFLNDQSILRKKAQKDAYSDALEFPSFIFDMHEYEPGTLKAVAYIDNKIVAEHSVTTAGKASKLKLSYDISGKSLELGKDDLVFLYAHIEDDNNTIVHNAENRVKFEINTDEAEIIGANPVRAEAGIATVLLKVHEPTKAFVVKATANTLQSATLTVLE